jgi:hypothetical protein
MIAGNDEPSLFMRSPGHGILPGYALIARKEPGFPAPCTGTAENSGKRRAGLSALLPQI